MAKLLQTRFAQVFLEQMLMNLMIPKELYAELEEFLKDSQGRYPSIFDVVKVAIIEFLKRQKC